MFLETLRDSARPMLIQSIIYGNPDFYPPMLHSAQLLHEHNINQVILCSRYVSNHFPLETTPYAESTLVTRVGGDPFQGWRSYLRFLRDVWAYSNPNHDCIVGYDLYGFFAARVLAWKHRRPLVYHVHDYSQWSSKLFFGQKIAKIFELLFARSADLVIVPDAGRAKVVKRELRLRRCPLIVANATLKTPDPSRMELRNALTARGKQFSKIVWRQGMIGDGQGLVTTLKSVPFWADSSWGFVIMGPGEESYKEMLRRLANEIGVSDQFEILPSVLFHDVAKYTVGSDIGHGIYEATHVNNRHMTTASNKTMEYIAAGKPILLSDSPANRAIIDKYQNGVVVDCTDPASVANGVNRILLDADTQFVMSEGSYRAFAEEFNYAHQYEPVIAKFREFASRRHHI